MSAAAAPASSQAGTVLVAIHSFSGEAEGDLPFKKGETVFGIELNGQWWTGRNQAGATGSFPMNYVKEAPPPRSAGAAPVSASTGMAAPPPGPVVAAEPDTYGQLPGAPPPAAGTAAPGQVQIAMGAAMTRDGTVAVVRSLQWLASLMAMAFMGSTTDSFFYKANQGGQPFVLAMAVIGWLASFVYVILAVLQLAGKLPEGFAATYHASKCFTITLLVDVAIFLLSLLAVTLCPTAALSKAGSAGAAGAIFLMLYLWLLGYSILMSYKDVVRQKLLSQGWAPPRAGGAPLRPTV